MHRRNSIWLFLALVGLVAAACGKGQKEPPGVNVKSISTDIGLGASKPFPGSSLFDDSGPVDVELTPPPFSFKVFRTVPPAPTAEPCPEAELTEFPGVTDPTAVQAGVKTKEGAYRWYESVARGKGGAQTSFESDLRDRQVGSVKPDTNYAPDAFQYTILHTERRVQRVNNQNFPLDVIVTETFRVAPTSPAARSGQPSDVGRGIFLISHREQYSDLSTTPPTFKDETFAPQPPIQYADFPFDRGKPVANGSSTGTDPTQQMTMTSRMSVMGNVHIDACGQKIDAWKVAGEQEVSFPVPSGTAERPGCRRDDSPQPDGARMICEYLAEFAFANYYGGLIVYEKYERPRPPLPRPPAVVTPAPTPPPTPTPRPTHLPPTPRPTPTPPPTPRPTHLPATEWKVIENHTGAIEPRT